MAGLDPRLSGSIFLGKAHGIDSNHFQSLATRLDMKKDQRRAAYEYGFPRHFETAALVCF
jgi:hypothetical protein